MKKILLVSTVLFLPFVFSKAKAQQVGPPGVCNSGYTRPINILDASTVVTGGTPIIALISGHALCGGWLVTSNAAGICVDEAQPAGVATGTPSSTTCVGANTAFYLVPTKNTIYVNSTGSNVSIAGVGLN